MKVNYNTDIANSFGNVTIKQFKNGVVVNEITKHNEITDAGILSLLNSLVRNYSCYLRGISVLVSEDTSPSSTPEEYKFYTFSAANIVSSGLTNPYAEIRFYLSTNGEDVDEINGKYIVGFKLLSRDNSGTEIDFATVDMSDTLPGTSTPVFNPIEKTSDVSILVIWRIAITSIFTTSFS